jgi:hypothetical protein
VRSSREIVFRVAQQLENLRLYVVPPKLQAGSHGSRVGVLPLPDPDKAVDALRGTSFAVQVEILADEILAHRFLLFGQTVATGPEIQWRKDYIHGQVTGMQYFRFIPYLDFEKSGDHKNIWELNRHQHLITLAQAFLFTGKQIYITEIEAQLSSWFVQNPYLRGINFASALEVAFRALSWLWVDHLVGSHLSPAIRGQLWNGLFQHGHYLHANLSTYFSPNTHLLGEGVALHALGLKFPETAWEQQGHRILAQARDRQIQADGSHFEQSTYYHVYALDFFLFYYLLANRPVSFEEPLRCMARFLEAVHGPGALLHFFGDDDGGRLFYPYGDRAGFGRATLATCAQLFPDEKLSVDGRTLAEQAVWWLGPVADRAPAAKRALDFSAVFPDSGLVTIARGDLHILIDTGSFGGGGAGHSHSDTLSLTVRLGERELLIDPGTFTYVADPRARDEFRGSGYHNTIRVDGTDQADATKPFRWDNKPQVSRADFRDDGENVYLDAECRYRGVVHRRRFFLLGKRVLFIVDDIVDNLSGAESSHLLEQFWHMGADSKDLTILSTAPVAPELTTGWRSRCLGSKEESPVVIYRWNSPLPVTIATALVFEEGPKERSLLLVKEPTGLRLQIPRMVEVLFPTSEPARVALP